MVRRMPTALKKVSYVAVPITLLIAGVVSYLISATPAVAGTGTTRSAILQDTSQLTAVRATFANAMLARQQLGVPVPAASGAAAAGVPTAAQQHQSLVTGQASLARYFSPAAASQQMAALNNVITAERNPQFRMLGAGVSNIQYVNVAVAGSTATVQADVTTWSRFELQQLQGQWAIAEPSNVLMVTATLAESSNGKWTVTSLQWDFAPGSQP